MSGKRIGDYILTEKIGKGGQATVWKALAPDGTQVAIKKMSITENADNQKSYDREVAILKLVKHEYLIRNLNCFKEGNYYYLVYEYCPIDLLQMLQKQPEKRFPEKNVRKWISQLTQVMTKLNSVNIIHRDLKPENILLNFESLEADIRLADFGLARQGMSTLSFVGTFEYASPEIKNCQQYSFNTDVWSLGVIAFAALYGKFPIFKNVNLIYPTVPEVSADAKQFLATCLTFNQYSRPNFDQLLNHPFLNIERPASIHPAIIVDQRLQPMAVVPSRRVKTRTFEQFQHYFRGKVALFNDIEEAVLRIGNDMLFLEFFCAKYCTEKLAKLLEDALSGYPEIINSRFFDVFFAESERVCAILSDLEIKFKNLDKSDFEAYSIQIEEVINSHQFYLQENVMKFMRKMKTRLLI